MAKNIELYNKSVDILYQAYLNDELKHLDPCFCAIGNLVKASCGNVGEGKTYWFEVVYNKIFPKSGSLFNNYTETLAQINSTGYSIEEVISIENAFESAPGRYESEEIWMFNGLTRVLDKLAEIHETDNNIQEKDKFEKHYQILVG